MAVLKTLLILVTVATAGIAQINISGTVRDSATGTELAGAIVQLPKYTLFDTTDTLGKFQLQCNVGITTHHPIHVCNTVFKIGIGNRLEFESTKIQRIKISAVNLRGRTIATVHNGMVVPGKHCFQSPVLPAGYYLYAVDINSSRFSVPFIVTSGLQKKSVKSGSAFLQQESGNNASVSGSRAGDRARAIDDTIVVTTRGYFQRLVPVKEEVITGLEIKCWRFTDSITDVDGNVYHTVVIGSQTWLVENLKTTRLNDSTPIPLVEDSAAWAALRTPGYCYYNNDSTANKDTYGALYNWYAVGTGKLAPKGWHVPTRTEWDTLIKYLGDYSAAGSKMKEAGLAHWNSPNKNATNETGFSALPDGLRLSDGIFNSIREYGYWWMCTEVPNEQLISMCYFVSWDNSGSDCIFLLKYTGLSIRCLKD